MANAIIHCYKLKDDEYINRIVVYCKGYNLYLAVHSKEGKIKGLDDWTKHSQIIGSLPDEVYSAVENEYVYVQETGLDYSMCQVYSNGTGRVDSPFGEMTITDSFRTQERELCVRKTQNGRVLDKNSDPVMLVPDSKVEKETDGTPYTNLSGKAIAVDKDYDIEPKYVTWDSVVS